MSNWNLLKCKFVTRQSNFMRLACNINFFRFVSNSFLKDLNFCKHPFLNTWLSIVWHLKIPCFSSNVLASILSAFAIGIIDNPLGIARTVAKNAWGICVFPLESFRFKNAYALHPPETVRCFIDARLDEISFFFYREASLPTICYAVYWMSLYWLEKK